jgi:hypothetical protein
MSLIVFIAAYFFRMLYLENKYNDDLKKFKDKVSHLNDIASLAAIILMIQHFLKH